MALAIRCKTIAEPSWVISNDFINEVRKVSLSESIPCEEVELLDSMLFATEHRIEPVLDHRHGLFELSSLPLFQ